MASESKAKVAGRGRGRPPKNKDVPPADLKQVSGEGHNSVLTDDQRKALTFSHLPQYMRLIDAKKSAANALQNFGKIVKADLGKYGLDMLKIAMDDRENGEEASTKLKEELEAKATMARWLGMPIGVQGELFGKDRRTAEDRAEQDGFEAGSNRDSPRTPPEKYGLTTKSAHAWYKGYDRAQTGIFDAMAKKGNPLLQSASIADDEEDVVPDDERDIETDDDEPADAEFVH